MRAALAVPLLLAATACGTSTLQTHGSGTAIPWPAVAKSARAQWYRSLAHAPAAPVTLSERGAKRALADSAHAVGVRLVRMHYEPAAGGSAELVVQPPAARSFANAAGVPLTPLLEPLARADHAYLVTVVDHELRPLLVLGWTPGVGGGAGQGIGWQAEGIHSSAIIGQPVTAQAQFR